MRSRSILAVIGLVVLALSTLPSLASPRAAVDTRVTIKTKNGDFWGYIYSPKLKLCAKNRKVVLYRQLGKEQNPKTDKKIGSDISSLNGTRGEWNTGNTGLRHGKYYARAPKTVNCKADSSDTVRSVPTP